MKTGKICVETLREELKNPITNTKQAWRILERMASCFVAVSQDVHTLGNEVYGNGTPGGLKTKVAIMEEKIDGMRELLSDIRAGMDVSYGRRKGDLPFGGNATSFDKFTNWLADKIIPSLVVGLLTFVANVILFAFAVMFAVANNWIKIP